MYGKKLNCTLFETSSSSLEQMKYVSLGLIETVETALLIEIRSDNLF